MLRVRLTTGVGLLAIIAPACAAHRPPAPVHPAAAERLASADALIRAGCYDCLVKALAEYRDVAAASSNATAGAAAAARARETAGRLAVRERALGLAESAGRGPAVRGDQLPSRPRGRSHRRSRHRRLPARAGVRVAARLAGGDAGGRRSGHDGRGFRPGGGFLRAHARALARQPGRPHRTRPGVELRRPPRTRSWRRPSIYDSHARGAAVVAPREIRAAQHGHAERPKERRRDDRELGLRDIAR